MNETDTKHKTLFIVFFFFVALCINGTHSFHLQQQRVVLQSPFVGQGEQQQQEQLEKQKAAAAQQAAVEAAKQHAAYLARYLNPGFSKTLGSKTLALVVATADGKLDHAISTTLANHFKNGTVEISTSFFNPEFVSDNLFANLFDGSAGIITKLELAKSLDALLLARLTVQYSTSPALDNVTTAHVKLEVQVVPVASSIQNQTWTFTANGPGFSQGEALSSAEERLTKQINNDTTMSLGF